MIRGHDRDRCRGPDPSRLSEDWVMNEDLRYRLIVESVLRPRSKNRRFFVRPLPQGGGYVP
jgi:hypothetical protein